MDQSQKIEEIKDITKLLTISECTLRLNCGIDFNDECFKDKITLFCKVATTFNNDFMVNILNVLREIKNKTDFFSIKPSEEILGKVHGAFNKGIELVFEFEEEENFDLQKACSEITEFVKKVPYIWDVIVSLKMGQKTKQNLGLFIR